MRRARSTVGAVCVIGMLACALTLTGCVPDPPDVVPTSEPTARPVFASDAEALAAAKTAYEGYLKVSDQVAQSGGISTGALSILETTRQFERDSRSYDEYKRRGVHSGGRSTFRDMRLQRRNISTTGELALSVYVCLDVSKVRVLNAKNIDVTPARPDILPLIVTFVSSPDHHGLLLDGSQVWSGTDYC